MINKKRYIDVLIQVLKDYYEAIKRGENIPKHYQPYIDGYLKAARALDVFGYEELKEVIDKIHFETFGKTIEARRKSQISETSSINNDLKIPTYLRGGISLNNK